MIRLARNLLFNGFNAHPRLCTTRTIPNLVSDYAFKCAILFHIFFRQPKRSQTEETFQQHSLVVHDGLRSERLTSCKIFTIPLLSVWPYTSSTIIHKRSAKCSTSDCETNLNVPSTRFAHQRAPLFSLIAFQIDLVRIDVVSAADLGEISFHTHKPLFMSLKAKLKTIEVQISQRCVLFSLIFRDRASSNVAKRL